MHGAGAPCYGDEITGVPQFSLFIFTLIFILVFLPVLSILSVWERPAVSRSNKEIRAKDYGKDKEGRSVRARDRIMIRIRITITIQQISSRDRPC